MLQKPATSVTWLRIRGLSGNKIGNRPATDWQQGGAEAKSGRTQMKTNCHKGTQRSQRGAGFSQEYGVRKIGGDLRPRTGGMKLDWLNLHVAELHCELCACGDGFERRPPEGCSTPVLVSPDAERGLGCRSRSHSRAPKVTC